MNKSNYFVLGLLVMTSLYVASCSASTPIAVQSTLTAENIASATTPHVDSPTQQATVTNVPAEITPTTRPTQAVVPTHTPVPMSLPNSESAKLIKDLLATNANCELPCWWGIQPGSLLIATNIDPITRTLSHHLTDDVLDISVNNSDKDVVTGLEYQVNVAFALSATKVSEIRVHGGSPADIPPPGWGFGNDWHKYAPHQVLTKLEMPNEVRLSAVEFPSSNVLFFTLDVIYPDKGIAIHYNGFGHKHGAQYMICPTLSGDAGFDGVTTVDLLLTSSGDVERFNDSLSRWTPYKTQGTLPIRDAIGLSVGDFYKQFKDDVPDACFNPLKS